MNNNNDKETTRHTHSKTHLTQASTFISSQPKYTNTMSGIDTSHIIHQIKRNFSSYDEHSKESFQTYNNINKETSNFITSYKLILSKKEKQTEKIKDPLEAAKKVDEYYTFVNSSDYSANLSASILICLNNVLLWQKYNFYYESDISHPEIESIIKNQ